MADTMKTARLKYMAEVDPTELACRILEAGGGTKRPPGKSAAAALDQLPGDDRKWLMACALAALDYISECFSSANRVS